MLLFCDQPSGGTNEVPTDERAVYSDLVQEMDAAGHWVTGAPLDGDEVAVRVRNVDGAPVLTDGPFAEITDMLSGMFIVDVPDRQTALDYAARIPAATNGVIEVRRIYEGEGH